MADGSVATVPQITGRPILTLNVVNASALTSKLLLSIQSKKFQNTPSPF